MFIYISQSLEKNGLLCAQGQTQSLEKNSGYKPKDKGKEGKRTRANSKSGNEKRVIYPRTKSKKRKEQWLYIPKGKFKFWEGTRVIYPRTKSKKRKKTVVMYTQGQIQSQGTNKGYIPKDKVKVGGKQSVMYPRTNPKGKEQWLCTQGQSQSREKELWL